MSTKVKRLKETCSMLFLRKLESNVLFSASCHSLIVPKKKKKKIDQSNRESESNSTAGIIQIMNSGPTQLAKRCTDENEIIHKV